MNLVVSLNNIDELKDINIDENIKEKFDNIFYVFNDSQIEKIKLMYIENIVISKNILNEYKINTYKIINNTINSNIIYFKLLFNDYVIIYYDDYDTINNIDKNNLLYYHNKENNYIILYHNLIYYFPLNYISFSSITDLSNTLNLYNLSDSNLPEYYNNDNDNDNIYIYLLIHNINYNLCNIIKYIYQNITHNICIYDMNSYDGIDYELITSYYNCEYFYLTGADLDSILFTKKNNKRTIYINLINDYDYSIINIYNIIYNKNYKNIHFEL